jgi:hypothetical protein
MQMNLLRMGQDEKEEEEEQEEEEEEGKKPGVNKEKIKKNKYIANYLV